MKKIVIDTLGGDNGALPLLYGSADYMKEHSDVFCVFAGEKTETNKIMAEKGVSKDRYTVLDTDEYISNTQSPMSVFGGCDNSSMVLGLLLASISMFFGIFRCTAFQGNPLG